MEWAEARGLDGSGLGAVVVGCGFGADAEYLSSLGFDVTAFDVAPSAVRAARRSGIPGARVHYVTADLLEFPAPWGEAFAFVFECADRAVAARRGAPAGDRQRRRGSWRRAGRCSCSPRRRDEADGPVDGPPWPLTRAEVESFATAGSRRCGSRSCPGRAGGRSSGGRSARYRRYQG